MNPYSSDENTIEQLLRDDIRQMKPYVPGEQPQTGKVIKLNTNENPYPPSERVSSAIVEATKRLERYPDPLGTAFRMRAADLLGVSADHILCGNGSDDILTILTRAFVPAGGCIRMPTPSYILYRTLAEIQSGFCEEIPFAHDFSITDMFAAPTSKANGRAPSLAFLPNPNSPSGTLVSRERIVEISNALPCPLVVDEAYVDFAETNCASLVLNHPKILVTRTLSKSYALAGLRFGYLVAHPKLIAQLRKVKDSYNCDALAIAAATAAIDDQAWLVENVRKVRATRKTMTDRLKGLGFDVTESQANFVWCTHPNWPLKPIYEQLKSNNVLVRFMDYSGWGQGLRISVGSDSEMDVALSLLQELL